MRWTTTIMTMLVTTFAGISCMSAGEPPGQSPELRLSLHDAIQAAIDNNVNVRLLQERIAAAQAAADTNLGALLPNVAMTVAILMGTALSLFAIVQGAFHLPVKGSLFLFFSMTALYVFTTAGLGLLISTFTTNQAQVGLMTILLVAPMLLLSGTWTPPEAMPEWARYLTLLSPLHYFIDISYGILLKGIGLGILLKPVLAMTALGGSLFGFGM